MSIKTFWVIAVLGYVVQTKCLSSIHAANYEMNNRDINSSNDNTIDVYLTFIYFSSWVLLAPLSKFLTDNATAKSVLPGGEQLGDRLQTARSPNGSSLLRGSPSSKLENLKYFGKLLSLSLLVFLPMWTYNIGLSLSPAFDVALIHHTSIFEITILLYGVCGLARRQNLFRTYITMVVAVFAILIVSYTKATCDMLAGKLTINPETGELTDPFLFDRLKGALICGLGNLSIGPFAVLYNRWFNQESTSLRQQGRILMWIGLISMAILLPLFPQYIPNKVDDSDAMSLLYSAKKFWLPAFAAIIFGTMPHMLSLMYLNRNAIPEYITTTNLATIIAMGLAEWILEPGQTYIVRWEVISFLTLTICCIILSVSFYDAKKFH